MTLRLTVLAPDGTRFSQLFITGLGSGLAATGQISPASLDAAAEALPQIKELCGEHGACELRAVGTEAARRAGNRSDLEDLVLRHLGVDLEVLSSQDEARLAFRGSLVGLERNHQPLQGPVLMLDIGGASTEFAVGVHDDGYQPASWRVESDYSAEIGTVTVSNEFLSSDPPKPEELSAALSVVELHVDDARREIPARRGVWGLQEAADAGTVVGVGGAITATAAVEIGLEPYDPEQIHGFALTHDAAEDVFRTLATESLSDRIHNPGLSPKRAEVILGGLCVLVESFRQLGMDEILVSDRGVSDGIAAEMLSA